MGRNFLKQLTQARKENVILRSRMERQTVLNEHRQWVKASAPGSVFGSRQTPSSSRSIPPSPSFWTKSTLKYAQDPVLQQLQKHTSIPLAQLLNSILNRILQLSTADQPCADDIVPCRSSTDQQSMEQHSTRQQRMHLASYQTPSPQLYDLDSSSQTSTDSDSSSSSLDTSPHSSPNGSMQPAYRHRSHPQSASPTHHITHYSDPLYRPSSLAPNTTWLIQHRAPGSTEAMPIPPTPADAPWVTYTNPLSKIPLLSFHSPSSPATSATMQSSPLPSPTRSGMLQGASSPRQAYPQAPEHSPRTPASGSLHAATPSSPSANPHSPSLIPSPTSSSCGETSSAKAPLYANASSFPSSPPQPNMTAASNPAEQPTDLSLCFEDTHTTTSYIICPTGGHSQAPHIISLTGGNAQAPHIISPAGKHSPSAVMISSPGGHSPTPYIISPTGSSPSTHRITVQMMIPAQSKMASPVLHTQPISKNFTEAAATSPSIPQLLQYSPPQTEVSSHSPPSLHVTSHHSYPSRQASHLPQAPQSPPHVAPQAINFASPVSHTASSPASTVHTSIYPSTSSTAPLPALAHPTSLSQPFTVHLPPPSLNSHPGSFSGALTASSADTRSSPVHSTRKPRASLVTNQANSDPYRDSSPSPSTPTRGPSQTNPNLASSTSAANMCGHQEPISIALRPNLASCTSAANVGGHQEPACISLHPDSSPTSCHPLMLGMSLPMQGHHASVASGGATMALQSIQSMTDSPHEALLSLLDSRPSHRPTSQRTSLPRSQPAAGQHSPQEDMVGAVTQQNIEGGWAQRGMEGAWDQQGMGGAEAEAEQPHRHGPAGMAGSYGEAEQPHRHGPAGMAGSYGEAEQPYRHRPAGMVGSYGEAEQPYRYGPVDMAGSYREAEQPYRHGPAGVAGSYGERGHPSRRGTSSIAGSYKEADQHLFRRGTFSMAGSSEYDLGDCERRSSSLAGHVLPPIPPPENSDSALHWLEPDLPPVLVHHTEQAAWVEGNTLPMLAGSPQHSGSLLAGSPQQAGSPQHSEGLPASPLLSESPVHPRRSESPDLRTGRTGGASQAAYKLKPPRYRKPTKRAGLDGDGEGVHYEASRFSHGVHALLQEEGFEVSKSGSDCPGSSLVASK
eukprot:gene21431-28396_t